MIGTEQKCYRVIGIDTSLRSTGIGVIEAQGNQFACIHHEIIRNPPKRPLSACLVNIYDSINRIIRKTNPDTAAIEGIFTHRNSRTAIILGQARGAAITACAAHGLRIYEHPPKRVKQAVSGYGGATKDQVGKMVATLLNLPKQPQEDIGDALAIAICHLNTRTGILALMPTPI